VELFLGTWLSILPPLFAISYALLRKEVIAALLIGIFSAEWILAGGNPFFGLLATFERCVQVFEDGDNVRVLAFGLLVGALLELMQKSGGVAGFVEKLASSGLTRSKRQVSLLTSLIGTGIFVETSMSCLTAGVVSMSLFDRFRMSRARLAFLLDSTCAPVSVLILLNGWGAYILRLLEGQTQGDPLTVMLRAIPLNFYPLLCLALVYFTALTTRVYGPMRLSEQQLSKLAAPEIEKPGKARHMLVPLLVLVGGMLALMVMTGWGRLDPALRSGHLLPDLLASLQKGQGARAVLWAVGLSLLTSWLLLLGHRVASHPQLIQWSYQGMARLLPVVFIMMLSFAIGGSCKALGTGGFVAGLVGSYLPAFLIAPLLFLAAAFMSFTTGTSWGTFAIMVPVGMPLAASMGLPEPLLLAAILGGGVFGDHASPISDTTLIASLASGCDHLEHVRTQLPYALVAAGASAALYLVLGLAL